MKKPIAAAIAAAFSVTTAFAADDAVLKEVIVSTTASTASPMTSDPQPTPRSSVTRTGLDLLGGPGQVSIYAPLKLMPSVVVENPDPYGMSPSGNINIRGKSVFHVTRNVEGLPLTGIVGGTDLFDLENVEREDLYRGGLQAHQGLGISNASGVIDQRLLAPKEQLSATGKASVGSYDFRRAFARVDSGNLSESGTRFFISGSTTAADKWKGAGDESRDNFAFGASQRIGDLIKIDLYAVNNHFSGNSYRPLTYAQTQSLGTNYKYDYDTSFTGAGNSNYYAFNRSQYDNWATLANIELKLAEGHRIVLKPYYWHDDGFTYSASGANVQIWRQQNDNRGGVLEYQGQFGSGLEMVAGYWMQSMAPPPPPTDQRLFTVGANGSLNFSKWSTLSKIDNFEVRSPYVQLTQSTGGTTVSGGVRYMSLGAPKMQYYCTSNTGAWCAAYTALKDASYDDVWSQATVADVNATVAAKTFRELLPNIGIRHEFNPTWSTSLSYGRKFGRPDWGPQASNFISNEAAFVARGITLQTLVNNVRPELSDQIDFGVQYKQGGLTLTPSLFYAKNKNRQVMVTDPALGGLSYYQGTARTTQYGAELEGDYQIGSAWSLFGSVTLASETYDDDTPSLAGGSALATKGKQIPNAPRSMLKGGVTYRTGDFAVSPVVRYVGRRYGDSVQGQPVSSYTLVDLNASYAIARDVQIALSAQNLFNQQYVAQISPNDFSLNPTVATTSYYVGAPRTVIMSVSAKF